MAAAETPEFITETLDAVRIPRPAMNTDVANLIERLEQTIRVHCVEAMRDHTDERLNTLDTRSLVADDAAWKARFPSTRPRSVQESDAMLASPLRARYADGLARSAGTSQRGAT